MIQAINCQAIAEEILDQVEREVQTLPSQPHLAVILVGDDPASSVYVRNKEKRCERVKMASTTVQLAESSSVEEIKAMIEHFNTREDVHGILLQLPLPNHLKPYEDELIQMIHPMKDVDGLTHQNQVSLLNNAEPRLDPCTPQGCVEVLKRLYGDLTGLDVVMVGRSKLVGLPLQLLLTHEDATVTLCHSRTRNLVKHTRSADVVVSAIGKVNYFNSFHFTNQTTLIDVGINRNSEGKLCGDIDTQQLIKSDLSEIQFTPTPGGTGLLTTAFLMKNTLKAYCLQQAMKKEEEIK